MDGNDIHAQTVDPGGKSDVDFTFAPGMVERTPRRICKKPPKISEQMGPREARNLAPDHAAGIFTRPLAACLVDAQAFYRLRVQFDAKPVLVAKPLQLLGQHAFRAVLPVNRRGYHSDSQDLSLQS